MKKFLVVCVFLLVLGAILFITNPDMFTFEDAGILRRAGTTVDLRAQGLTTLPSSLFEQTDTEILLLSNNRLTSLPSELGKLTNVEELRVDHNNLTGALPAEIRQMPNLGILDAANNMLTGIPAEIGQLSNLRELYLQENNIGTYPEEIHRLVQLRVLDVRGNAFTTAQIAELEALLPNATISY